MFNAQRPRTARSGGSWLYNLQWRPNGQPDYGINEMMRTPRQPVRSSQGERGENRSTRRKPLTTSFRRWEEGEWGGGGGGGVGGGGREVGEGWGGRGNVFIPALEADAIPLGQQVGHHQTSTWTDMSSAKVKNR